MYSDGVNFRIFRNFKNDPQKNNKNGTLPTYTFVSHEVHMRNNDPPTIVKRRVHVRFFDGATSLPYPPRDNIIHSAITTPSLLENDNRDFLSPSIANRRLAPLTNRKKIISPFTEHRSPTTQTWPPSLFWRSRFAQPRRAPLECGA